MLTLPLGCPDGAGTGPVTRRPAVAVPDPGDPVADVPVTGAGDAADADPAVDNEFGEPGDGLAPAEQAPSTTVAVKAPASA